MTAKKMAVYVEGQTEQIFVKRLIEEVAGSKHVQFAEETFAGGKIVNFKQISSGCDKPFFVLLYDCRNDEKVKSKIIEDRPRLAAAGYDLILGLRDLYPSALGDLAKVKQYLGYGLPTAGIVTHILLAVAEVESWFLQDASHYSRVSNTLDPSTFKASFGFDPAADTAESVGHPADLLHSIYQSVGLAYKKTRTQVERTVQALDYEWLCLESGQQIPHFAAFSKHIDTFLTR